MKIEGLHHIAIICSDYQRSKRFYTEVLGFKVDYEVYRAERESYLVKLSLNGSYLLELFSFPNPPERPSYPEAQGLRHICFKVGNLDQALKELSLKKVDSEPIRIDEHTQKRFSFIKDPDGLPIEICEH